MSRPLLTFRRVCYLLLLVLLCIGIVPSAVLDAQAQTVGSILYLVQANATQVRQLPGAGLTVHTALLTASDLYIASGDAAAGARAAALGATVRVLDTDTQGKVYFLAEAGEPNIVAVLSAYGPILYQDATDILIGVPSAREAEFVQQVPAQGGEIYALPLTPYVPPEEVVTAAAVPAQADPLIRSLVNAVSADALYNRMADMSGARPVNIDGVNVTLTTSYTYSPVIRYTEQYIFNAYKQMGYNPVYVPWSKSGASGKTIVADLPGVLHPERIWIVDGHFDTTSQNPTVSAPGADDNASGVAITLVIAGLLKNQRFSDTIRFVGFSGEEQGMLGSQVYAAQLKLAGVQLMGVMDLDQLGYDSNNDHVFEIHSGVRANSLELARMFIAANTLYQQGLVIELKDTTAARWSDHSSFWDQGFAAMLAEENWFTDAPRASDGTPCWHKVCDTLATVNLDYVHRAARTALATVAHLSGIISGPTPTPSNTPTATLTPPPSATPTPSNTPTATFTRGPVECADIILNGGFETVGNWLFGSTARPPIYVTSQVHSGTRALQMGIPPGGANAFAHSSARQQIVLPASATNITLTYWERTGGGDGTDYRELLLLNASGVYFKTLERVYGAGTNQWQARRFDLTAYRGQTVYVYLNTYNNGAGGTTWNYVDDVSVQACTASTPSSVTRTPTATPSPSATGTFTTTPSRTATATATHTATLTPTDTVTSTTTSTTVPTDTPTATATRTYTTAPTNTATLTLTATTVPTETPTRTLVPTMTATATTTETFTSTPTFTSTQTVSVTFTPTTTATWTPTATPVSGACSEIIVNGGFETNSAWSFGSTARPAGYVSTPVHGGARALRLGILPGTANATSYSSARQVVVVPLNAATVTLRYWERPGGGDASDYREALILSAGGRVNTLARSFGSGNNEWQFKIFDMGAYRGQTVTVYFNTYNAGTGSTAWDYIDDVSLLACAGAP